MDYLFGGRPKVATLPKIMFRKSWALMLIHISPPLGFPARIMRKAEGAHIDAGIMAEIPQKVEAP